MGLTVKRLLPIMGTAWYLGMASVAAGVRHLVHIVVDQETERLRFNRARPQP